MPSLKKIKDAMVAGKTKSSGKTAKPSALSNEYVQDSDPEDESDIPSSSGEDAPIPVTPKTKGPSLSKDLAASSQSKVPSSAPNGSSQPKASSAPNGSSQMKASSSAPRATSTHSTDSESEEDSESEGEDSSDSEESSSATSTNPGRKRSDPERPTATAPKRKRSPELQLTQPTPPYKPPNGFEPIPTSSATSSVASKLFSASDLTGRQIWHITAPSLVPVSLITQVSLESVAKGAAALTYKGTDYGFVVDAETTHAPEKLFIAGPDGTYQSAPLAVAQTLQLQQLINLPSLQNRQSQTSSSSQGDTTASAPAMKPVRQQPKGLKMRFGPSGAPVRGNIGVEASSSDESPTEREGPQPDFRTPQGLRSKINTAKRKHSNTNASNNAEIPSPKSTRAEQESKSKKPKHNANHSMEEQPQPSPPVLDTSMDVDSPSEAQTASTLTKGTPQSKGPGGKKETDQERTDRKAKEKEKRKAQKIKDREGKGSHKVKDTI